MLFWQKIQHLPCDPFVGVFRWEILRVSLTPPAEEMFVRKLFLIATGILASAQISQMELTGLAFNCGKKTKD